ncbi:hypothetical protein [Aliarcobacter butzleri]|uniref:hypothetical protein n=1 Tax=Aliarcobacter butzleri TaxID=28197 RepID=UPI003AF98921
MMNMHIEKVYCKDLDKIINIYDAEIEYFKQDKPRKRFEFYCSDEKCRKEKNPKVAGINYDKHPEEGIRRAPHFRKVDEHIAECEWIEISEALEELSNGNIKTEINEEKIIRKNKLKITEVIEEFITEKKRIDKYENNSNDENLMISIKDIENRDTRKKAYQKLYTDRLLKSKFLHKIVSCYTLLSEKGLLENIKLKKDNTIMSYREWFKHIAYYNDNYKDRIFYGGATVSKFKDIGYTICFFDKNKTETEYKDKMMTLFIKANVLNSYKHKNLLIDIFKESEENKKYIKCFFIAKIELSEKNIKVHIDNLDHIHIMFKS